MSSRHWTIQIQGKMIGIFPDDELALQHADKTYPGQSYSVVPITAQAVSDLGSQFNSQDECFMMYCPEEGDGLTPSCAEFNLPPHDTMRPNDFNDLGLF